MNERYSFKEIEKKWQKYWEENDCFHTEEDESKKKILLPRDVPVSFGKAPYGACKKLLYRRRGGKV